MPGHKTVWVDRITMKRIVIKYFLLIGNGLDFERSDLKEVMKAAADGEFDVLLIIKLDRLKHDTAKTLELFKVF